MRRDPIARLFIFTFVIAFAAGQASGGDFWRTPGETMRDASGKIIRQELKDPATYTMRVFERGQWLTYRFQPNTDRVLRVEGNDTAEDYLYDAKGGWSGIRVHGYGRPLTVRASSDSVSTDGLPAVTIDTDDRGRHSIIRYGSQTVAAIQYATSGEVRQFALGNLTLGLSRTADGFREVLSADERVIRETTALASGQQRSAFPLSLDAVADRLHLGPDWSTTVRTRHSDTGTITEVHDGAMVIARLVKQGPMRVAFDAAGDPLFYEVRLNYGVIGGDTDPELTRISNAVLPTRVIITRDGVVSAYVERPADSAFQMLQTSLTGSAPLTFKIFNAGKSSAANARRGSPGQFALVSARAGVSRAISPLMIWQCGSTETWQCVDRGGNWYCENNYTPVYCNSGDGGGYTPPPDDGGGGGGANYDSNDVVSDPNLTFKVNSGLTNANNKLANTRCSEELLNAMPVYGGRGTALQTLQRSGLSATDWINQHISFVNGTGVRDNNGTDVCAYYNPNAWTTPYNTSVNVCSSFKNLASAMAGTILIHEMLHTLGVSEKPADGSALYTSAEITAKVAEYCP